MPPRASKEPVAAQPLRFLQTVELSVPVPIPPRDSPEFQKKQKVPIVAGFPPFCSGEWYAFVQWAGGAPKDLKFGVGFKHVKDWVVPEVESFIALEDFVGTELDSSRLHPTADFAWFPFKESHSFGLHNSEATFDAPPGASQARIRIKLVFEPQNVACSCRSQSTSRFNDLLESRMVNDVRFYFPHVQRELWSNSNVLINASSYFKSLFGGGFSESTNWTSEPTSILDPGNREDDRSFEDSDDEADNILPPSKANFPTSTQATIASSSSRAAKKAKAPTLTSSSSQNTSHQFREIIVKSASYTTYRAILAWIESGQITYRAALHPSPPPTPSATPAAPAALPTINQLPTLPNLPSPKSVYRLAQFLDLPKLAAHSLEGIKSRLTVENIAAELFGDVSMAYPDVQQMELEFAAGNWEKVKDSAGMKEMERKLDNGEGTLEQGAVAMKLARRLK